MTDITERLDQAAALAIAAHDPNCPYSPEFCMTAPIEVDGSTVIGKQAMAARRAILAELDAMGWQCVPKEATSAMLDHIGDMTLVSDNEAWRLALQAAPQLKD